MANEVVVAGAGPTGLMLAAELRLGGLEPVVLERLPEISEIPKGNGLVGQIVPWLDYRGLRESFAAGATWAGPVPQFAFGPLQLDLGRLGVSPLHILAIPQRRLERLLDEHLRALGGTLRRGHELRALSHDDDGLTLDVASPDGGYQMRARYLVGCDGAHSFVRKEAGIGFPGVTSPELSRIGRISLPAAKPLPDTGEIELPGVGRLNQGRMTRTPNGAYSVMPLSVMDREARPGTYILFTSEEGSPVDADEPMALEEFRASVQRVLGAEVEITEPVWLSRTIANSRQADRYRVGRIFLAGDAAHLVGLGGSLNVGLLDAVNLGWKLAAEVHCWAPTSLLDSYHTERYPVAQRAILSARAQRALSAPGEAAEALRSLFGELLQFPEPLRHVGDLLQGSDIRYDMGTHAPHEHRLVGRLAPDLRLETEAGSTRVAEIMRAGRPALLDLTPDATLAAVSGQWHNRVDVITASALVPPAPVGVLIRPDGYVAWAAGTAAPNLTEGLHEALTLWFGPPAPSEAAHGVSSRGGSS